MLIVGIGGTTRPGSSTEQALEVSLAAARTAGAETTAFSGARLELPMYGPGMPLPGVASELIEALRSADGVIVASPGYHGTISGLVKNVLDYTEEMRDDDRSYFDGRAMGCIGVAYGWQAAVSTLQALRSIAHALRAWPTPAGAVVNSSASTFDAGRCTDDHAQLQLELVGRQVAEFAALVSVGS